MCLKSLYYIITEKPKFQQIYTSIKNFRYMVMNTKSSRRQFVTSLCREINSYKRNKRKTNFINLTMRERGIHKSKKLIWRLLSFYHG